MKKISESHYRRLLYLNCSAPLFAAYIIWRIANSVTSDWVRFILMFQVGMFGVISLYSLYQLSSKKAFRRGFIARNDERYQVITEKCQLFSFRTLMFVLGLVTSLEGSRYLFETPSILTITAWEFNLVLFVIVAISFSLAKIYYTRFW